MTDYVDIKGRTKSGVEFPIRARILVSKNELSPTGYHVELRMQAVFPRCRKTQSVTTRLNEGEIVLGPLFGWSGEARITPDEYFRIARAAPVLSDPMFPVVITSEIEAMARQYVESTATCPAVTGIAEAAATEGDAMDRQAVDPEPRSVFDVDDGRGDA